MSEDIGLFDAIYSQRAIRHLRPDPVTDEVVHRLIEAATKAPSGGNSQPWRFLVIRDKATRRMIADYYRRSWDQVYGAQSDGSSSLGDRVRSSATHLAENMAEVPVLILACIMHDGGASSMGRGSSIYPAVQNLLLAARGLGLGSVMTSLHKRYEDEIKQALGIPENVETAALLPIGYPAEGVRYGPTRRQPVEEVTYWERWGSFGP
jgi:nitroreductase